MYPIVLYCIMLIACILLLARLMDQHCFDPWHLSSSVVVCNTAGGQAGAPAARWAGGGQPALFGGPVVLRPVRATPCVCYIPLSHHVLTVLLRA